MFRRITAIIVLVVLLVNLTGYLPVFKLQQWQVRREIKQRLKKTIPLSDLHVFSFSEKDMAALDWLRDGKEFRLNGHLYDVVSVKNTDGKLRLYCIDDTQENRLFTHLNEIVKRQTEDESSLARNISLGFLKNFLSLVFLPGVSISSILDNRFITHTFFYYPASLDICPETFSPPPRIV